MASHAINDSLSSLQTTGRGAWPRGAWRSLGFAGAASASLMVSGMAAAQCVCTSYDSSKRSAVLLAQRMQAVYVVNACQSCAQPRIAQRSAELGLPASVFTASHRVWSDL